VAAGVAAALAAGLKGLAPPTATRGGLSQHGDGLIALAGIAAIAGYLGEASFGLPTAPAAVVVWVVLGLIGALRSPPPPDKSAEHAVPSQAAATGSLGRTTPRGPGGAGHAMPQTRSDPYGVAAEGIVDGVVLATVAFAPLLLPSPVMTANTPAMWLLLPLVWIAGDALGEAVSSSPWTRPGARLIVVLAFGSLFALHPNLNPGGQTVVYAIMLVAATLALGLVLGRTPARAQVPVPARGPAQPAAEAGGMPSQPAPSTARMIVGASAGVALLAFAWHTAIRPARADALVLSSLEAGARGDYAGAVTDAENAVALWPEQPALASYLASAHRAVMLDPSVAVDLRDAAYERALAILERAFQTAPAADTAAKIAALHRDRGDAAPAGEGRELSWEEAVSWYEQSLELQPVAPATLTGYAATLERLAVWDGAGTLYARALDIEPARHEARAGAVRAFLAAHDVESARLVVEEGLAIDRMGLGAALEAAATQPVDPLRVTQSRVLYLIAADELERDLPLVEVLRRDAPDDPVTKALLVLAQESPGPTP
jgi:tetratricopeptide (TPR) repeat protein